MNFSNNKKMYDAIIYFMIALHQKKLIRTCHISTVIESFIIIDACANIEIESGVMYNNPPLHDKAHYQYYNDIVSEINKSKTKYLTIENDIIIFHRDNGRLELCDYDEDLISKFCINNL